MQKKFGTKLIFKAVRLIGISVRLEKKWAQRVRTYEQ